MTLLADVPHHAALARQSALADLGGLRGRQKSVAPEINGFWENESFHNYADYAMSERFRSALAHLRERGRTQRCAIICAETV